MHFTLYAEYRSIGEVFEHLSDENKLKSIFQTVLDTFRRQLWRLLQNIAGFGWENG